jgi:hypothetical protein
MIKSPYSEEPELYLPPPESDRPEPGPEKPAGFQLPENWELIGAALADQIRAAWEQHLAYLEIIARVNLAKNFMNRGPGGVEFDAEKFERAWDYLAENSAQNDDNGGETGR